MTNPETPARDALMQAHTALAAQAGRDQAALARVRRLHDALAAETDLTSPDDEITRGASAKQIAAALDGWSPPAAVSVPPPAPRADNRAALRDRIAEALAEKFTAPGFGNALKIKDRVDRPLISWTDGRPPQWGFTNPREVADAVLAVLPEPVDQADDAPAAECSAQNRNYESGPRLCIRAAQHHGDHIDERGFHWSDTVAVYPVSDGTFRRGTDVRAELRRLAAVSGPCVAGEQQNETPEAEAEFAGTRPCGHDDYHDGHEWADRPGVWCPGIGYDEGA